MMTVYAERSATEKIHIHFDKTVYNKGETVWYKTYILQSKSSDSAVNSKNVYIEWYDADGKPITHTVAPVVLSTSSGSFEIPADYQGATLHVKAFTRWMLNDDPAFSYRRELKVNTNTITPSKRASYKTTLETFPEGGVLIQGLRTRIAFKAANQYGNPVLIKGVLADDKNNTLEILNVQHDGMGSFHLNPLPGRSYQLKWIDEYGVPGTTVLPVTKTEGAQLTVTKTTNKAGFQVERTHTVPDNLKKMIMVVHMNQVGLYQVAINATDKTKVSSEIPINDLPTGLLQFTLFTANWIPIAERVIFINNQSHEFDVKITQPLVNVDKKGKNALEVIVPDTLLTNMSLAITDADVSLPDQHTIFSDILLSSEIRGKVYNPGYYLSGSSDSVAEHLDLLMLTNGWRRFNWDKISNHIAPKIIHPSETVYMKLIGKVSGLKRNAPQTEVNLIVVERDSSRQFISVPLAKNGSFEHPMVLFDTATVFYSFNNNKSLAEKAKLKIANGMLQLSPTNVLSNSDNTLLSNHRAKQKLDMLLAEQELLAKAAGVNTLEAVTVTARAKTKLEKINEKYASGFFRGNPARRAYAFDLTDTDKPIVMQGALHFLQNRVPGLEVTCPSMLNCSVYWRRSDGSPDFYLDEMPATLDMILSIPVTNIALIKAFPPPFFYSSTGMLGGAIALYTKKMEDYKQPEVQGLPSLVLAGYSRFKEFYSPSYEEPGDQLIKPDNRTTLYWNPNLITNTVQQRIRIDYFNNDFTKTFKVVLEGINAAGKMTRVVKTINGSTIADR